MVSVLWPQSLGMAKSPLEGSPVGTKALVMRQTQQDEREPEKASPRGHVGLPSQTPTAEDSRVPLKVHVDFEP